MKLPSKIRFANEKIKKWIKEYDKNKNWGIFVNLLYYF